MEKQRKQIRLKNYDYSKSGLYFVTICTENRSCIFGDIIVGADPRVRPSMILNEFGTIVDEKINELKKYKNVDVDIYCVMPNHVHLILIIFLKFGSTQGSTPTVGEYIKRLKTLTTYIYIKNIKNNNWLSFEKRLWQRNYYEHIIRNEIELNKIRQYIINNPLFWNQDINY